MNKTKTIHTIIIYTDKERKEFCGDYVATKQKAYDYISELTDKKVGVLWYRQTYRYSKTSDCYIGNNDIINIVSKCHVDKSNWVDIEEAKRLLEVTRIDGNEKRQSTYKPAIVVAKKSNAVMEELKDEQ